MAAYDFPDTAGQPSDGSFTYTAPDGTLYEWNGYAWQVPDSGNPGGGDGGGNFEIPTQALPPAGASDGDMFWCTDDGRLYIYYEDADTSQWVDASPDNTSEAVDSYWAKSGSTLSPIDTADSVDIGSGNITLNADGSITASGTGVFGDTISITETDKKGTTIYQDGALYLQKSAGQSGSFLEGYLGDVNKFKVNNDGSAEFAGDVTVQDPSTSTGGVDLRDDGVFIRTRDSQLDTGTVFGVYDGGFTSSDRTITFTKVGSATFAGYIQVSNQISSVRTTGVAFAAFDISDGNPATNINRTVKINIDGSADFAGRLKVVRENAGDTILQGWLNTDNTVSINSQGNAEFAGTVTSNGKVLTRNVELQLEADDDTKYTATTDSDGNQTLVYNGAVLDVKERIQNVISRMDAIEANEVTDDATDSALLTLVASLSSRLDERDATIAALTTRITTLEIQSNGGN